MTTRDAIAIIERYDRLLEQYEAETIAQIDAAIFKAHEQLEGELRRMFVLFGDTPMTQRNVLIQQQLSVLLDVTRNTTEYQGALQDMIIAAAVEGSDAAIALIQAYESEFDPTIAAFAQVPLEAIAAQANGAVERMRSHGATFARKASAIIETNLALGQSVASATRALRNELGIVRSQAEMIARTETIGAFDRASQGRYEELGLYSQVFSVGDKRVCPYCAWRNGRVFKTADISIPFHPNDRCYRVPWDREWHRRGLIDDEFVNKFVADANAQIRSEGKQPDGGLAPFEKANGRAKPPEPIWSPSEL